MNLWKKRAESAPPVPPDDPAEVGSAADVEEMMKKYDRESNTRQWEGAPKLAVKYMKKLSEEQVEKRVAYEVSVSKLEVPVEEVV